MEVAMLVVAIMALVAAPLIAAGVFLAIQARSAAHTRPSHSPPSAYDDTELRAQMASLTQAVANGIKEVDRNNRRIESVVRRAQKELADVGLEHAGLESEAGELQLSDATGVDEEGVLPLHDGVDPGDNGNLPSGIPGATYAMEQELRQRLGR